MNSAVSIITGIFAFFFILNFPIRTIKTPPSLNPVYYYDLKANKTLSSTAKIQTHEFFFHRPVSGNYYSSYQYEVTKLGSYGLPELKVTIPANEDVIKSKTTASLSGKDGYLTYPADGSFFLWYPRLGNQTFFYDKSGELLWAHKSSHYMKAFPSGKYILSMTGDHSRAFYMLPNLSVLGSSEGTLLINYQFSPDIKNDDNMQLCMGYLDGDVVFYNPHQKEEMRISTGNLTKSIACEFNDLYVAFQSEGADHKQDEIKLGQISTDKTTTKIQWKYNVRLPERYIKSLPLGVKKDYVIVLIPQNNSIHLQAFDINGKLIKNKKISDKDFDNIENWRIYPVEGGLIAWNSQEFHILNPNTIFKKTVSIDNVVVENNEIFIQTPNGIIAYELKNLP